MKKPKLFDYGLTEADIKRAERIEDLYGDTIDVVLPIISFIVSLSITAYLNWDHIAEDGLSLALILICLFTVVLLTFLLLLPVMILYAILAFITTPVWVLILHMIFPKYGQLKKYEKDNIRYTEHLEERK